MTSASKMTKKQLKEMSENLNAYYMGGNVYTYENVVYYLEHRDFENIISHGTTKAEDIKNYILSKYNIDDIYISSNQLAYSVGVYGNSGQLHKIGIYTKEWELLETLYTYYC